MPGLTLLLQVLPLAVGAAISPGVLTVQILILTGQSRSLPRAWALALGRMSALLALSLASVFVLVQLPDVHSGLPSWFEAILLTAGGVVLLVVAVWERGHPVHRQSRMAGRIAHARPVTVFAFGFVWMMVNASTLALYIPAMHVITSSDAALFAQLLAFAILFLLSSAVVWAPAGAVTLFGDAVRPGLARIHDWLDRNSHRIVVIVCATFGIALVGVGIGVGLQL